VDDHGNREDSKVDGELWLMEVKRLARGPRSIVGSNEIFTLHQQH